MRGKVRIFPDTRSGFRITPAYAGKRALSVSRCCWPWDHPRICGEKDLTASMKKCVSGSPPHMRGKASRRVRAVRMDGITPAYAGKSTRWRAGQTYYKDHPRICGEKASAFWLLLAFAGSPPHMRGKGRVASEFARHSGITPAYAGKRQHWRYIHATAQDHPRICGEKVLEPKRPAGLLGSPPHMRGKG